MKKTKIKIKMSQLYEDLKSFSIEELQKMLNSGCFNDKELFLIAVILDEKIKSKKITEKIEDILKNE